MLRHYLITLHYVSTARQNRVMQRLIVIDAVFMPLSLIAGINGMNFQYMLELGWLD